MKASKKKNRYFQLAKRVAEQSDYGRIKHGAILVKGGSVINTAHNKSNFCSFGRKFRASDEGIATLHAELGAILGLPRDVTRGGTIYVVRINREGHFRLSKPCSMCSAALKHCGISRVYYSTNTSDFGCLKF